MSIQKRKQERVNRRITRIRARVRGTTERPRLAVFRGLAHFSAQVIDDATGKTLASAYDRELSAADREKTKVEIATAVGTLVGERAKAKGVTQVVISTFVFSRSAAESSRSYAEASVLPVASSITCAEKCARPRNTARRGRSVVPRTRARIRVMRRLTRSCLRF
jgi:large subunit ribosomal protein L18